MTFEAHEVASAGECACQAHHHLYGFGAGGNEAHAVSAGDVLDDSLGQLHLGLGLQHARGHHKHLFEL